jgi:hypothetical protein
MVVGCCVGCSPYGICILGVLEDYGVDWGYGMVPGEVERAGVEFRRLIEVWALKYQNGSCVFGACRMCDLG